METLHWHRPGSVWAIDHSQPPRPIDGCYPQILAIRDLASGMQLAWTPVVDATTAEALPVLEALVLDARSAAGAQERQRLGVPCSQPLLEWLARWQIVPLFSPVRMPRYNGECEAGIGAAKRRTEYLAARARPVSRLVLQRSVCRPAVGQRRTLSRRLRRRHAGEPLRGSPPHRSKRT